MNHQLSLKLKKSRFLLTNYCLGKVVTSDVDVALPVARKVLADCEMLRILTIIICNVHQIFIKYVLIFKRELKLLALLHL